MALEILRGTSSTSLCYDHDKVVLQDCVDAHLSGDIYSSKSTSKYIHTIDRTTMSWMSKL